MKHWGTEKLTNLLEVPQPVSVTLSTPTFPLFTMQTYEKLRCVGLW